MDKKSKNTLIVSIIALALVLVGVTYAYFSARITGLESASTLSLTAGRMGIVYSEGDENVTVNNIYPREEAWLTKTITLTGWNTTDQAMKYNLFLNVITNTFPDNYLTYDLRVLESTNGIPISQKTGESINGNGDLFLGRGTFTLADGDVHRYELKIYFKDNGLDQNDGQGSIFNAKINISEFVTRETVVPIVENRLTSFDIDTETCNNVVTNNLEYSAEAAATICAGEVYSDEWSSWQLGDGNYDEYLIQEGVILNPVYGDVELDEIPVGYQVTDGVYTYTYGQYLNMSRDGLYFTNMYNPTTWSAALTDVLENGGQSTNPVTLAPYKTINGIPVTSYSRMFLGSEATSIDFSLFDTSSVTDMRFMLSNYSSDNFNLEYLDTSNVTNMEGMFDNLNVSNIDASKLNMSNVIDAKDMFSRIDNVVLKNTDLRNITSYNVFSSVKNVDLSGSQISSFMMFVQRSGGLNGINDYTFNGDIENLNLSNTNLTGIFSLKGVFYAYTNSWENLESVSFSNAYAPNLTSTLLMFSSNTTLQNVDLSNFRVPVLSDLSNMFSDSQIDTVNLNGMGPMLSAKAVGMFLNSNISNLIIDKYNTSQIVSMFGMFENCNMDAYDLSHFNTSNVLNMSSMFKDSTATNLDLSSFDTANVTNMSTMFKDFTATSIDLSSFDTSKVTKMTSMFSGTNISVLDLSSFDTSNVTDMVNMFQNTTATIGYARTQNDLRRFNNYDRSLSNGNHPNSGIPNTLTFVLKN